MPCDDKGPIRWLFHRASEYGAVPPTQNTVELPLRDGDELFCVIENSIPSQGEGEQSTKFGGPCPYCPQPPTFCKFVRAVPPLEFPLGAGLGAGAGLGTGAGAGAGAGACAIAICNDCCLESPLASETDTPKLKFPAAVGIPETAPVALSRLTP